MSVQVALSNLFIRNFKGIREMDISFATQTVIAGRNEAGKTSVADAFTWLLVNKSIAGATPGSDDFREKPVDKDGNEIHNLETSVEAHLMIGEVPVRLKRIQKENWVTPRGKEDSVFKGNVSTYSINGVEVLLKEYTQRLSTLLTGEDQLMLLVSATAFNSLEWKKRREILLRMLDSDIDDKLLASDEFRPIAGIMDEHGIGLSDVPRWLNNQRKAVNAELQLIPARINEKNGWPS